MIDLSELFPLFDEFCRLSGISESTLSSRLYGESKKIALLRAGGGLTVDRFNYTVRYLDGLWPEGAVWKSKLPRPSLAVTAA